jgi:hypothetical protein
MCVAFFLAGLVPAVGFGRSRLSWIGRAVVGCGDDPGSFGGTVSPGERRLAIIPGNEGSSSRRMMR